MFNSQSPSPDDLPTSRQLIRSTVLAAVIAAVLLVTVVLPAEYGVDPTGIGRVIGLTRMGQIKRSLALEAKAEEISGAGPTAVAREEVTGSAQHEENPAVNTSAVISQRSDTLSLVLAPDEGAEIKVTLTQGNAVRYRWSTDGAEANFDTHADSKAAGIKYHGYGKGRSSSEAGELIAAFDGNHGWFWRNRSASPLTLTLETSGPYMDIVRWP